MSNVPKLSIVILSYNTKDLLRDCLKSLEKVKDEVNFEIIVPDNGSVDGSVKMVKKYSRTFASAAKRTKNKKSGSAAPIRDYLYNPTLRVVENGVNLGFAAGNNRARKYCKGKYILFLNSDTLVHKNTLRKTVKYLDNHEDVGALTCKMVLGNGKFDKDTRRSFITPWIGFTHMFLKLDRLFPKSKLFGQYWYGYIPDIKEHEVDVIQGAYFLVRKRILDKINWFGEDYFLDGEDIDLCWKIKEKCWKIVYYPKVSIIHYKGLSKGKVESETKKSISLKAKLKFRMAGVNSMEIFYRKRLWKKYPLLLNLIVLLGIKLIKVTRSIKTVALR